MCLVQLAPPIIYSVQVSTCFWHPSLASVGIEDLGPGLSTHLSVLPCMHSSIVSCTWFVASMFPSWVNSQRNEAHQHCVQMSVSGIQQGRVGEHSNYDLTPVIVATTVASNEPS